MLEFLGNPPLPNPYGDPNITAPIMPLQQLVVDILFVRTSYVKKIIEDCSNSEDTIKLLRFCCWENPQFSSTVLSELLWQVRGITSIRLWKDVDDFPIKQHCEYCNYNIFFFYKCTFYLAIQFPKDCYWTKLVSCCLPLLQILIMRI